MVKINDEDHTFTLDEDALNEILSDDKVKDKPVCVVSGAGETIIIDTQVWISDFPSFM